MTIEELQLDLEQHTTAALKLITACQLRAAQNYEKQTEADAQKSINEMEASAYVAEKSKQQAANYMRPCVIFRPALTQEEDDSWAATYGDMRVTGPTPETAHQEFDRLWVGKDEL